MKNIHKDNDLDLIFTFKAYFDYLAIIIRRSSYHPYTLKQLHHYKKYFRKCYEANLSPEKALYHLIDYINGEYIPGIYY